MSSPASISTLLIEGEAMEGSVLGAIRSNRRNQQIAHYPNVNLKWP